MGSGVEALGRGLLAAQALEIPVIAARIRLVASRRTSAVDRLVVQVGQAHRRTRRDLHGVPAQEVRHLAVRREQVLGTPLADRDRPGTSS